MRISLLLSLASLLACTFAISVDDLSDFKFQAQNFQSNDQCSPRNCKLPNCRCSGFDIPSGLSAGDTPLMIVLTFQNGIRRSELIKYQSLFSARRNPNGCPATGTFFVSHENTDYFTVQKLRSDRHEIGVNGINATHTQEWWKDASFYDWFYEMQGEKEILKTLANISENQITGERAPYLQMGGDNQTWAMIYSKIKYDASRVSVQFANPPNLLWPYTYDYSSTQDCIVPPCPQITAPGIWQVPLLALTDQSGHPCAVLDACNVTTKIEVSNLLISAATKHYLSNRAPLVLTLSAAWVLDDQKMAGTLDFLKRIGNTQDVYLVSADRMLEWIKNPTRWQKLSDFEPFKCNQAPPPVCSESAAVKCLYNRARQLVNQETADVIYRTTTCHKCPPCYPWVGDTEGRRC